MTLKSHEKKGVNKMTDINENEINAYELGANQFADEDFEDFEDLDFLRLGQGYGHGGALWSEILPFLWQGGTQGRDTISNPATYNSPVGITEKDFDFVVTMYADARPVDWFVQEMRFGIWDSEMKNFDESELFDIAKLAHKSWTKGKRTLIRCQAGWNRSGLIMALVLMREGYKAQEAIDLIRDKRSSNALCNKHFVAWLLALETDDVRMTELQD
jgi:protein-tyrosine phosphatase